MDITPDLWCYIGSYCASVGDVASLTSVCRAAYAARANPLLAAGWLHHHSALPVHQLLRSRNIHHIPSVINAFVLKGVNLNSLDRSGFTPLITAVQQHPGHLGDSAAVIQALISGGADLDICCREERYTAIVHAARLGNTQAALQLIAAGADVNKAVGGRSPLFFAVVGSNEQLVRALLKAGADVNAVHGDGYTLLMLAAMEWSRPCMPGIMQALMEAGVDVGKENAFGETVVSLSVGPSAVELSELKIITATSL